MRAPRQRWAPGHLALIAFTGAASLGGAMVTGHPLAACLPVLGLALGYALFTLPLRTLSLALVAIVLVAESPQDFPSAGLWVSPLQWLGKLWLSNLNSLMGGGPLAFSVLELCCAALVVRLFLRRQFRAEERLLPGPLNLALWAFLLTLLALGVVGLARGGDPSATYWQIRQLKWLPVLVWIVASGIDSPLQLRALGKVVVWTATAKAVVGIYFLVVICLPRGLQPAYVTTHSDTVLFVLALAVLWIGWVERPGREALRRVLLFSPLIVVAVILNDRRVAWVELAAVMALTWSFAPLAPGRRRLTALALLCAPLAALYLAAGWNSEAPVFRPVASIRTMADAKQDSSTRFREMENYNLARTFAAAPLLGAGLGHPYQLAVSIEDISRSFVFYRYVPHNSVLWLFTAAGLAGFTLLLSPVVASVFLAARCWHRAKEAEGRTIALGAIAGMVAFLLQAFGDMGTQSWSTVLVLALCIAASGRFARLGAVDSKPAPGAAQQEVSHA